MAISKDSLQNQAVEDYLKTIYLLAQEETPVSTSRIAEARQIKPSSVTSMIQKLAGKRLVDYQKHNGVTLTKAGSQIALEMLRHHRLLELFLTQELGYSWEEVHEEAEILEHVISEKFEDRIATILNQPQFDPHGEPIPTKDGIIIEREGTPLNALSGGFEGVVVRITDDSDPKLLAYLAEAEVLPAAKIRVIDVAPFDGPITVEINKTQRILGYKIASKVIVKKA